MSSWCFFYRSKAPAWSLQAQLCLGEGAPSLFPVPAERGTGAPPPTAAEVAQASHQSLRRNTRKAKGGGCETTST